MKPLGAVRRFAAPAIEGHAGPLLIMGAAWVAILAIFAETAGAMVDIWTRSATFGHGYLIPLISLGLIWFRRRQILAVAPRYSLLGLALVAGLSILWLVAHIGSISVAQHLALVLILQCSVIAVLGWRVAAAAAFPLAYLAFMVPAGEFLVPPMQDLTAAFVVRGLRFIDVPVFADGLFIHLPNGSFLVAEACAGLNYLITMVALGSLFANLFFRHWWRRLVFMAVALAIPVVMNGFRAFGIVLLAHVSDNRIAVGVDHLLYGWLFLSMTTMAVLAFGLWLRERGDDDPHGSDRLPGYRVLSVAPLRATGTAAVLAVLVAGVGPAIAQWQHANESVDPLALELPTRLVEWNREPAADRSWKPYFAGNDGEAAATYRLGDQRVDLYVAHYNRQRQGAEIVNAVNSLEREGWIRIGSYPEANSAEHGSTLPEGVILTSPAGDYRLAYTLYWVADRFTGSPVEAKLLQVWAALGGVPEAGAIVLSAPYSERPEEAAESIRQFARHIDRIGHFLRPPGS